MRMSHFVPSCLLWAHPILGFISSNVRLWVFSKESGCVCFGALFVWKGEGCGWGLRICLVNWLGLGVVLFFLGSPFPCFVGGSWCLLWGSFGPYVLVPSSVALPLLCPRLGGDGCFGGSPTRFMHSERCWASAPSQMWCIFVAQRMCGGHFGCFCMRPSGMCTGQTFWQLLHMHGGHFHCPCMHPVGSDITGNRPRVIALRGGIYCGSHCQLVSSG